MDYETLATLDAANTPGLPPADAAAALNGLTVERNRTTITTEQLWENTDLTEYAALAGPARQAYSVLIDLGTIDVSQGSNSRTTLATLFPAGSATRDNLVALVQTQETVSLLVENGLPAKVYARDVEIARERFGA